MINLTPHEIILVEADGAEIASFPASGVVARVSVTEKVTGIQYFDGIPVDIVSSTFGEVTGLPEDKDARFLVSGMVLDRLGPEYQNIAFAPDTGPSAVRNAAGHIVGVTRLRTVAK